jgi:hypothetical protein
MNQNSQNFHIVFGVPYENTKYRKQNNQIKNDMKELYNDTFNHVVKSENLHSKKIKMNDTIYFLHDFQSMEKLSKNQNSKNLHIHCEGHPFISGLSHDSEFNLSPQKMAFMIHKYDIPNIATISLNFCNSATKSFINNKETSFAQALSEELSKFDNTKNIIVSGVTGSLEVKDSGKITNVVATGSESHEKNRKEKKVTASYENATSSYINGEIIKEGKKLTKSGYYNNCSEKYKKIWDEDTKSNDEYLKHNDLSFEIYTPSPSPTSNEFKISSLSETTFLQEKKE